MAAADYYDITQQIYISYFGRPADPRGREAMAAALDAAQAPTDIVEFNTFYKTNATIKATIDAFGSSDESAKLYGVNGDVDTFINSVFVNVLGRPAKLAGLNFWNAEITSGRVTKAGAALAIMAGAFAGDTPEHLADQKVIENKISVADAFTTEVNSAEEIIAYKGTAAAATARTLLQGVTGDTDTEAYNANIVTTLENLVTTYNETNGTKQSLTIGTDTLTGGSFNDTFTANLDAQSGGHTVTGLDKIDGGLGVDTLNVTDATGGKVDLGLLTVTGVERLNVTSVGALVGNAANVSAFNGLTSANFVVKGGIHTITAADTTDVTVANSGGGVTVSGGKSINVSAVADTALTASATALAALRTAIAGAADATAVEGLTAAAVTAGTITAGQKTTIDTEAATSVADAATAAGVIATAAANTAAATGAVVATTNAALVSATVKGGTTVTITDASKDNNTLTSVSLDGNTGAAALTGKALTTVSVANTNQNVTVNNATEAHTLNLSLNNVTGGTIADAAATTLNISAVTKASKDLTISAGEAKATTIDAAVDLTVGTMTANKNESLVIKGAGLVTIAAGTLGALKTVDASGTTGGLNISAVTLTDAITFTGGEGKDSITIGATTKAIDTGAGDDTVAVTLNAGKLGTGGSINAGAGTGDTLVLSASDAATATGNADFAGTISGFEKVSLTTVTNQTVNLANLDAISNVQIANATPANINGAILNNLTSGGTVTNNGGATAFTVNVKDAQTGTADVVNIAASKAGVVALGTVTVADVETINFATDDAATTATGVEHTATLVAAAAKNITVAGDAGLTLTFTGIKLTSFDASGVTKGDVALTTGDLEAAATIKGGADANTFDWSATSKAVTYTGGKGIDTITAGDGANVITTGAGNDVIELGNGKNTVDAGEGSDTITFGANLSIVTGGAGTDHFVVGTVTNGNTYTTITDFAVGEDIAFGGTSAAGALGSAISLGGTAAFADFLNAAAAGNDEQVEWFVYGGDTYVVVDNTAGASFNNGTDQIVKLTGTVDLSASTVTAGGLLTFVAA